MPNFYSAMSRIPKEPQSRFYPPQGSESQTKQSIPSAPTPVETTQPIMRPQTPVIPNMPEPRTTPQQRTAEMTYFEGRYPILLKRLYDVTGTMLDTYSSKDFPYDAYPDYLSLRLMRDRLLRDNETLTEEYLQAGCPIQWLELLTDTILSEQLCRRRQRNPMGEANTTSVRSLARS